MIEKTKRYSLSEPNRINSGTTQTGTSGFACKPRPQRTVLIWAILLCATLGASTAWSCTTFVLEQGTNVYFGRNLDWWWQNGLVIVNQRDEKKISLVPSGATAAKWTSRYGSVTFNQFGQEMPFGGMNETGLVVECSWLNATQYAPDDSRPSINLLQWIQYQLDNCRSVAEVLATGTKLRIYAPNGSARVHYFICDAQGKCATVEVLDGKMITHSGNLLPYHALANDTYENSVDCVRQHPEIENLNDRSSLWRFSHAATRAATFKTGIPEQNIAYAFTTLDEVAQRDFTVWSVVYDISNLKIYYRTRNSPQRRSIDLARMDFSSRRQVLFTDIDAKPMPNDSLPFQELSEETQRKYLMDLIADPALKRRLGDLMPQVQGQLLMLRQFSAAEDENKH